jgi:hypothetical protein
LIKRAGDVPAIFGPNKNIGILANRYPRRLGIEFGDHLMVEDA